MKDLFDGILVSFAKQKDFVQMTLFIFSELVNLSDQEFEKICKGCKLKDKINELFKKGLEYISENGRIRILRQKMRFRSMVCIDVNSIKIIRKVSKIFKDHYDKKGLNYFLGK